MRQSVDELAITGIGCVSGIGVGRAAFETALFEGRTALAPVTAFDTSPLRSHLAGQLDQFDPSAFLAPAKLRRIDRVGRLAVACCRLTLEDAGFGSPPVVPEPARVGVAIGTMTSGLHSLVDYLDRLAAQGPPGASALDFSNTVGNAAASLCGIEFGLGGPNVTLSLREASAFSAVAHAAHLVTNDRARAIVIGAADDFEALYFSVHDRFGALATDTGDGEASRPFDRRRNGFVLGSGAFMLLLEHATSAAARHARVYGFIAGIGTSSSRARLNHWPGDPSQLVRCMRQALASAGIEPADVVAVFASANSTVELDRTEAAALAEVFGARAVPTVSVKGALGECSASGAASLVAALLALGRGMLPPTVGCDELDPDCPVDAANIARPLSGRGRRFVLVNTFASGGANGSVVAAV